MTDRITAKVRTTKQYDKFNPYAGNRGHEPPDLKKLILSMEKHGWWDSMPMSVKPAEEDDSFDIMDGHTRFFAAQELELPLKYVVLNGEFNEDDIILANETQRSWTTKDYCKSWAHRGKKDYQLLLDFVDEYKVGLTAAVALLSQTPCVKHPDIKSGLFKIVDENWAIESLNYLIRMNSAVPFSAKKQKFVYAFIRARMIKDFDPERFVHQVIKYAEQVKDFSNAHDIAQNFEDVYNYRRSAKNQVPLAFTLEQIRKGQGI